ncbi:MAG: ubiquinone biosynthesis protein UbiA, partial [Maribacter sp.]
WGVILMSLGIGLAFYSHFISGIISVVLTVAIIGYDAFSKKHGFLGPLNMGICRGLNFLLGISILGSLSLEWTSIVPVVYIFAITLISRGEVHGDNKNDILLSGLLYAIVIASIALIVWIHTNNLLVVFPFLVFFGILIFRPLIKAYQENSPKNIKKAVIAGVLSLVVMNACWVAGFSGVYMALLVLLLLPLSMLLSKLFAVT